MTDDIYQYTITGQRTATIKIKRSVFICTLAYAASIDQAKNFISKISKEHQTATHNCWAYIIGENGQIFHSSDAGEPSGTAGKPMLNALQRRNLSNIAAVVTRHFGGVKLGVRGLIDAYTMAVETTVGLKELRKMVQTTVLAIEVSYEFNEKLLNQIKHYIFRIKETSYTDKIVHTIEIEARDHDRVTRLLSDYQSRGKLTVTEMPEPLA